MPLVKTKPTWSASAASRKIDAPQTVVTLEVTRIDRDTVLVFHPDSGIAEWCEDDDAVAACIHGHLAATEMMVKRDRRVRRRSGSQPSLRDKKTAASVRARHPR